MSLCVAVLANSKVQSTSASEAHPDERVRLKSIL